MAGTVAHSTETKPALVKGIDPLDEPSAAWGWHGHTHMWTQISGWLLVAFLVVMGAVGNHRGNVELYWSIGIAVVIGMALLWDLLVVRNGKAKLDAKREADHAIAQTGTGGAAEYVQVLKARK